MPQSPFSFPFAVASGLSDRHPPLMRDIVWDRPIFRAPLLPNPRVIFDPLPFRAQTAPAFGRRSVRPARG